MINIILTLVFSIVMLLFMLFPAMKLTEFIDNKFNLNLTEKQNSFITISFTILFSLLIGIFLRYF